MGKRVIAAILLGIVVVYGGVLRLVGQNWDDFSHIHPDERFLTLFVLPQMGGANSFTGDHVHFPDQEILTLSENTIDRGIEDLRSDSGTRLGVVRGSVSEEVPEWYGFPDRVTRYDDFAAAENALLRREVDALLVNAGQKQADAALVRSTETIASVELQSMHCRARYPRSDGIGGYFDAYCSPFNPHNAGQGFYVYGTLPLFLAHFASEFVQQGSDAGLPVFDFQAGHLVWRGVSMIFDVLTILLVFALGSRIHNRWVGLLAALFYAAAPLAIQKAHFGTVNAVSSFLVALALYYAVGVQQRGKMGSYLMFGVACGAAVASRINLAPLAGIVIIAAFVQAIPAFDGRLNREERIRIVTRHILSLIVAGIGAFLAFRVFNPYAFEGPGLFGIVPNQRWFANLAEVSRGVSGLQDYPPSWQWVARSPLVHSFKDMVFWGMGLSFGVLGWLGWCWAGYRLLCNRKRALANVVPLVWIGGYYLFISRVWAIVPRYYLPLYAALAVLAGWCLFEIIQHGRRGGRSMPSAMLATIIFGVTLAAVGCYQVLNGVRDATAISALVGGAILLGSAVIPGLKQHQPLIIGVFAVGFSLLWGLMFSNVYRHQTTLVQATRFVQERVPGDFAMKIEGADDRVPLINIAVYNSGAAVPELTGSPYNAASHYYEGQPVTAEFRAPASGMVTEVFAPHLADPFDDPQPEEIVIRINHIDDSEAFSSGRLQTDLDRKEHPLGSAYTIALNPPLEVIEGETYQFVVEIALGSGDVIGSGSVVLTEGSWDNHTTGINICPLPDGLTRADDPPSGLVSARDCRGTQVHYALINSQDQIMSFPVDNQVKYDDMLRTLDIGDYLTIASNRFYDTEARNPMRWPLSTLYYEKLFAEELGYELVGVFDETFEFGPWRVSDQHLPIYDAPAWLNELEADESFHVYDHPAAFIFRKTDGYARERVEALLSGVSLRQWHELKASETEAQILGVLNWSVAEADPVPTALTFTQDEYDGQTSGGTWSDRFFSDALVNTSQVVGVIVWYLTIFVFGVLAFPFVFALLPNMADGGYSVSKLVGMLIVAWLAWAVSALKIPIWSQGGILFALGILAICSSVLGIRNRGRLTRFLRDHWRRLAWLEIVALVVFLVMIAVRLTNPDLWHPGKGGEKPMDFAYLNGVLRSTTFPPIDPWFAGGFINYYYFGYVLMGAPTLLLGVVPAFAYNLMIPTLFSLTGMGAFSAAFNIMSRWDTRSRVAKRSRRRFGNPWIAGIMALVLCVGLGNLDTVRVLGNGVAHLGGYDTPLGLEEFLVDEYRQQHEADPTPELRAELAEQAANLSPWDSLRYEVHNSVSLVRGLFNGLGRALQGEQAWIGSDRWYWGPSRVLAETPGVGGGAITEMPYFTFLYGDLHAHMISMPLVLLAVLLLFNEVVNSGGNRRGQLERYLAIALLALTVGVLQATNTWDWPSMTLFAVIALGYAWWLRWNVTFRSVSDGRFYLGLIAVLGIGGAVLTVLLPSATASVDATALSLTSAMSLVRGLLLVLAGAVAAWVVLRYLLVRASALDFGAQVGGFLLLNIIFALPYTSWYAATYNSVRLWDGGKSPLWAYFDIHGLFLFLVVSFLLWQSAIWLRATRVKSLIEHPGLVKATGAIIVTAIVSAIILTLAGYQVALIVIPLVSWIALLFFSADHSRALRFTLVLIGLALSMTLGVEVIVIGGDIGRQNTVFKFYMQVWLLLSVAGGVAFASLLDASEQFSRRLKVLWFAPCIGLLGIAALFPIMGTRARSLDRMTPDLQLTLNGMDYMTKSIHYESSPTMGVGAKIDLSVDHKLILWLQENVEGSPVIIEGRRSPSEYGWNGRIAITTGLPSVLGWNFHQRQQRTFYPLTHWVDQREKNIVQFYNTADIDIAVDILNHFDVRYIIRSGLEEVQSTVEGLQKLDAMVEAGLLSVAYEVDGGKIYLVEEEAMMDYLVERHS